MTKRLLSTQRIVNLSSNPVSGTAGEVYFNTSDQELKVYNGSIWEPLGGSGNVVFYQASAPESPAIGDIWVDSDEDVIVFNPNEFIQKSGGTFTGLVSGISPTSASNLTTKEYVDTFMSKSGGTFTGVVSGVTPTLAAHLTTKQYVDNVDTGLNPFFLGGM